MVKFLLTNGASANEKEMFTDKIPVEIAYVRKNQEIYTLIKSSSRYKIKWWKKLLDFRYY